jgi:hypothetical protein
VSGRLRLSKTGTGWNPTLKCAEIPQISSRNTANLGPTQSFVLIITIISLREARTRTFCPYSKGQPQKLLITLPNWPICIDLRGKPIKVPSKENFALKTWSWIKWSLRNSQIKDADCLLKKGLYKVTMFSQNIAISPLFFEQATAVMFVWKLRIVCN